MNRYDGVLAENDEAICKLVPSDPVLRMVAAYELRDILAERDDSQVLNPRVLDLGTGRGEMVMAAREICPRIEWHVQDISDDMLQRARNNLGSDVQYIHADAEEISGYYDAIISGWTLHNFNREKRKSVMESISLATRNFVLFDKVYTDDEALNWRLYERQLERFARLPSDVAAALYEHELADYGPKHRMTEEAVFADLEDAFSQGHRFSDISARLVDRVERDVVIIVGEE